MFKENRIFSKILFYLFWFILCALLVFAYRSQITSYLDPIFTEFTNYPLSVRTGYTQSFVLLVISMIPLIPFGLVSFCLKGKEWKFSIPFFISIITLINLLISMKTVLRRDDYWEIRDARIHGLSGFAPYAFMNFSGRFSSFFLKGFYSIVNPLYFIRISIFLGFIFTFLACWLFVYWNYTANSAEKPNRVMTGAVSIILTSGIYLLQTKIWETFYWGAGYLIYGISIPFTLFSLYFLLKSISNDSNSFFLISLVLGSFSTGLVQLNSISICCFSVAIIIYFRFFSKKSGGIKKEYYFH